MNPIQPNLISVLDLATAGPARSASELPFLELPNAAAARPGGFGDMLGRALSDARRRDVVAQEAVEAFARGDDPGRIHEVMVAVSKAEIALRTVASVRNKLLEAYRDLQHVTG